MFGTAPFGVVPFAVQVVGNDVNMAASMSASVNFAAAIGRYSQKNMAATMSVSPVMAANVRRTLGLKANLPVSPVLAAKLPRTIGYKGNLAVALISFSGNVHRTLGVKGNLQVSASFGASVYRTRGFRANLNVAPLLSAALTVNYTALLEGSMNVSPQLRGRVSRITPVYGSMVIQVSFNDAAIYTGTFWADDPAPVKPGWTPNSMIPGIWVPVDDNSKPWG